MDLTHSNTPASPSKGIQEPGKGLDPSLSNRAAQAGTIPPPPPAPPIPPAPITMIFTDEQRHLASQAIFNHLRSWNAQRDLELSLLGMTAQEAFDADMSLEMKATIDDFCVGVPDDKHPLSQELLDDFLRQVIESNDRG